MAGTKLSPLLAFARLQSKSCCMVLQLLFLLNAMHLHCRAMTIFTAYASVRGTVVEMRMGILASVDHNAHSRAHSTFEFPCMCYAVAQII
jgi:hypothetical protein